VRQARLVMKLVEEFYESAAKNWGPQRAYSIHDFKFRVHSFRNTMTDAEDELQFLLSKLDKGIELVSLQH
jgi:hypothetical protein